MLNKTERLLRRIATSPDLPIQAGRNWASRNASIATGTSGVWLALREAEANNDLLGPINSQAREIFSAEFIGDVNSLHLASPNKSDESYLGDIFEGFCAEVWTSLVTRTAGPKDFKGEAHGSVDRPGLAHGETIRELCKAIARGVDAPISLGELGQVHGVGWCNGRSGIIAAKLVEMSTRPLEKTDRDFILRESWSVYEEVQQHHGLMEVGLCHGSMGAHVVITGAGRLLSCPKITAAARDLSQAIVSSPSIMNINESYLIDASWLTGVGGVLWGSSCVHQVPTLNPLLPMDSRLYENPWLA
jgi:hypothetical protein